MHVTESTCNQFTLYYNISRSTKNTHELLEIKRLSK